MYKVYYMGKFLKSFAVRDAAVAYIMAATSNGAHGSYGDYEILDWSDLDWSD